MYFEVAEDGVMTVSLRDGAVEMAPNDLGVDISKTAGWIAVVEQAFPSLAANTRLRVGYEEHFEKTALGCRVVLRVPKDGAGQVKLSEMEYVHATKKVTIAKRPLVTVEWGEFKKGMATLTRFLHEVLAF